MKYTSSNQDSREFHVPAGTYTLTILEATETISKSSGAEMIKLNLEVDGHHCRLFDYLIASEATAWKIDAFRRALGEATVEGEEVEIEPSELIGRTVKARLKTEDYNGKIHNKVDAWLPADQCQPAVPTAQPEETSDDPF